MTLAIAPAQVDAAADAVAQALADFDAPGQPGCAVGIYRDGALKHASGYGLADIEREIPIGPDTVFNIASVSKQMTAFAVFLLESRGQLSLDDSVRKHVPELGGFADEVTVRNLIHHTGGLRDYAAILTMQGRQAHDAVTAKEVLEIIVRQKAPNQGPGELFEYSNTGYNLLALIVERVTGRTFEEFSAAHIFQPLGMADTSIVTEYPADIAGLARGYSPSGDGFSIDESKWAGRGSGQVHTTIRDLQRWDENLYSGRVGGKAVVRRMMQIGTLKSGGRMSYAGGLVIGTHRGLRTAGHNGSWAGYRSELLRFPDQQFSVAMLCNRADAQTGPRVKAISAAYLGEAMKAEGVPSFARTLAGYPGVTDPERLPEGYYRDDDRGRYVRYWQESGQPKLMTAGVDFKLTRHGDGVFASENLQGLYLVFVRPDRGRAPRIVLSSLGDEPIALEFLAQSRAGDLRRYVGRYRSPEADVGYEVVLTEGVLTLETLAESLPLHAGSDGEFFNPDAGIALRFLPESGRAERFLLSAFQLRSLEFQRLK